MVIASLIKHYWLEQSRSPMWQKNIIINILLGLCFLYFIFTFLLLGFFADAFIEKLFPDSDTIVVFNGLILNYILLEMLIRFFIQPTPAMNITPYLHLPVKRRTLMHYLLGRSIVNPINYISFCIFLPFAFKVLLREYSFGFVIGWLFSISLFITSGIYIAHYLKRQLVSSPWISLIGGLLYVGIFAAGYFHIFSLTTVSENLFNAILIHPAWILLPVALLVLVYRINFSFLAKNAYLEKLIKPGKQKKSARFEFGFINQLGLNGKLMILDIKLILRNKRTKSILYFMPLFLLYGLFYYPNSASNSFHLLIFIGLFLVGILSFSYGSSIAWNGNYFDGILSRNANLDLYVKSKFLLFAFFTFASFLLCIPYVYYGMRILLINFSCLLFNIGVNSYVFLYFAAYNRKRLNLSSGSMMNWQGANITQFLVLLPVMMLPIIIPAIVNAFAGEGWALFSLAAPGIAGIIFNKSLLRFCTQHIVSKKYEMAAGYRET